MTNSSDPYNLGRFVEAQSSVIDDVKRELRSGRKRSHWMWFVFPQLAGLGSSEMAQRYARLSWPAETLCHWPYALLSSTLPSRTVSATPS